MKALKLVYLIGISIIFFNNCMIKPKKLRTWEFECPSDPDPLPLPLPLPPDPTETPPPEGAPTQPPVAPTPVAPTQPPGAPTQPPGAPTQPPVAPTQPPVAPTAVAPTAVAPTAVAPTAVAPTPPGIPVIPVPSLSDLGGLGVFMPSGWVSLRSSPDSPKKLATYQLCDKSKQIGKQRAERLVIYKDEDRNNRLYVYNPDIPEDQNKVFRLIYTPFYKKYREEKHERIDWILALLNKPYIDKIYWGYQREDSHIGIRPRGYDRGEDEEYDEELRSAQVDFIKTRSVYNRIKNSGVLQTMRDKTKTQEVFEECEKVSVCKKLDFLPFLTEISKDMVDQDATLYDKIDEEVFKKDQYAILKPSTGSKGRGIELVKDLKGLKEVLDENDDETYVAQSFIMSAYTNWNDYIWNSSKVSQRDKSAPLETKTYRYKGHKANIRAYVMILINHNKNMMFTNVTTGEKTTIPEFRVYVYHRYGFMIAVKPFDKKQVLNPEGNINADVVVTNLDRAKSHILKQGFSDYRPQIMRYANELNNVVDSDTLSTVNQQMKVMAEAFTAANWRDIKCANYKADPIRGCFHLFAFDTHMDADKKLWFIEANGMPGFRTIETTFQPIFNTSSKNPSKGMPGGLFKFVNDMISQSIGLLYQNKEIASLGGRYADVTRENNPIDSASSGSWMRIKLGKSNGGTIDMENWSLIKAHKYQPTSSVSGGSTDDEERSK